MPDKKYDLKDSGHRRVFESGAQRDRAIGKGKYALISPFAIKRLADIYEKGSIKYAPRNWELGMPLFEYVDSALRHLFQCLEGKKEEDSIGQACWNLIAAIHTEECIKRGLLPKELDNLPDYSNIDSFTRTVIEKVKAERLKRLKEKEDELKKES